MVTINNEALRNIYHYLVTIENTVRKESQRVSQDKSYLDKMVPEQLSRVYSTKEKTALAFIDNLTRTIYDNAVIALTATFERVVFAKYRTTYGVIRTTINIHSTKPLNYFDSKERFVNDQIDGLSGILSLIENIIDDDLFRKLKIIKDHRNFIAHGKRDSKPPAVEYDMDTIVKVLDEVIGEIEK